MAHFQNKGNSSQQGVFINRQGGPIDGNLKNISAEIYVAVDGENPNSSIDAERVIPAVGVIASLPEVASYFAAGKALFSQGALMAASELAKSKIEGAFTPPFAKLAQVGVNLRKKVAATRGYGLYVRVKYEKHEGGIFSGWKKEHTKWAEWGQDGQDGKGHFFYKENITESIVKKVMEWRIRLFVREGL